MRKRTREPADVIFTHVYHFYLFRDMFNIFQPIFHHHAPFGINVIMMFDTEISYALNRPSRADCTRQYHTKLRLSHTKILFSINK